MAQASPTPPPRRPRVLIPLDAEVAMRALMTYQHSGEPGEELTSGSQQAPAAA